MADHLQRRPPWMRYGAAIGMVGLGTLLRAALTPAWGPTALPFIFFWPVIVLAAWFGRLGPGLVSLALSALAADWFFIEPRGSMLIQGSHGVTGLLVFVSVGILLVSAIEGMHRANARTVRDVTEAKRAEERFRAAIESAPNAVLMVDSKGRIALVNAQTEKVFGYDREELLGKSVELLVPERSRSGHPGFREAFFAAPRARAMGAGRDLYGRRKDGSEVPVEIGLNPITTDEGHFVLASIVDISERKRTQDEIQRLNADLDRRVRERTTELEAFTYTVAHDLRAPLRAMQGFADLVLEDAGSRLEQEERDYLKRITKAADRMDALVRDLLAYSRLGLAEMKLEPVDLATLVRDVVDAMQPDFRARQAEVRIEEGMPKVLAQRSILFQVVSNLLSNAATFVAPGVAPRIRVAAQSRGGRVQLLVEDNGIGVDLQYREKLFGVFERLHAGDAYPGTGIGLAIVKRAVERMGGRVGVESREGLGSTFWVELPEESAADARRGVGMGPSRSAQEGE